MNDHASNLTSGRLADDRGYGLAMFLIFAAAALIVTGAVALLALVGSWSMLGVAFAVHVVMTALVTLTIVSALNGRPYAISDSRRTSPPRSRTSAASRKLRARS